MSSVIRLVQADIMSALSELQSAAQALEVDYSNADTGENVLEIADKLVEVNQSMSDVITLYKELLLHNEVATKEAVELLRQTESQVASQIQMTK